MQKRLLILILATLSISFVMAQTIPNFTIELLDGTKVKSETLFEKGPVFIDFWATWCQPCLRSMPKWSDLSEKYPDMQFYAISIDRPRDKAKVTNQVRTAKYAFNVGFDPNRELANLFNVGETIPQLFILSQTGEILFRKSGYNNGDEVAVEEAIKRILNEGK
jgi:thiol-disulfide isomerase/thioredoxin